MFRRTSVSVPNNKVSVNLINKPMGSKGLLNTSYFTDSYIVFPLKMKSVSKDTILGLKMMVKSGLQEYFWNSSMYFPLLHKSSQNQ